MDQSLSDLFHLVVRCDEHAPARVRAELDGIEALGPRRGDAKLVASELVSNAVKHSACRPDDEIDVRGRLGSDLFEIAVHDPGRCADVPKVRRTPEIGGLGLAIVEQICERWGTGRPDGRVVWAQLTLPTPAALAEHGR